jgi:hypothetical protein
MRVVDHATRNPVAESDKVGHDNVTELRPAGPPAGKPPHEALPVTGTIKRERDGQPLNQPAPSDFPVTAECSCGEEIRKREYMFADWQHVPVSTAPAADDPLIRQWANSGSRKRQIAATLARELASLPAHTRVESSMKIAARFGTSNTTAAGARFLLTGHKLIYKSGRHYFTAPGRPKTPP